MQIAQTLHFFIFFFLISSENGNIKLLGIYRLPTRLDAHFALEIASKRNATSDKTPNKLVFRCNPEHRHRHRNTHSDAKFLNAFIHYNFASFLHCYFTATFHFEQHNLISKVFEIQKPSCAIFLVFPRRAIS